MEWNLKSPTSANMPPCTSAIEAGAGLFDNGVFGREVKEWLGSATEQGPFFRNEVLVVENDIEK